MLVKFLVPMGVLPVNESSSMCHFRALRVDTMYFLTRVLFAVPAVNVTQNGEVTV